MNRSIKQIELKVLAQVCKPAVGAPGASDRDEIRLGISDAIGGLLASIHDQIATGTTNPWLGLNTLKAKSLRSPCEPSPPRGRVGVFPLAANPIHWGHIITCLFAIAEFSLDTMVLLPAGRIDYKPVMGRDNIHEAHGIAMMRLALKPNRQH